MSVAVKAHNINIDKHHFQASIRRISSSSALFFSALNILMCTKIVPVKRKRSQISSKTVTMLRPMQRPSRPPTLAKKSSLLKQIKM